MVLVVNVPNGSAAIDFIGFSSALMNVPDAEEYVFDFSRIDFVTPGWMVVVGDALRRFRTDRPLSKRSAKGHKRPGMRYAAHAGFFQYFGLNYGQKIGAVASTEAYLPLMVTPVDGIMDRALNEATHHGDVIQSDAERMVSVLTQSDSGDVFETLSYSIREIVRNVIEHSKSETYTFAAQYWPGASMAEIVVSDRGIGLQKSLSSNPRHIISNDLEALRLAVTPGVSSKNWRKGRSKGVWSNSGYGLYMTKSLCTVGGSFAIVSGSKALVFSGSDQIDYDASALGTTVVMRLATTSFGDLTDRLAEFRNLASLSDTSKMNRPSGASLASRVTAGKVKD